MSIFDQLKSKATIAAGTAINNIEKGDCDANVLELSTSQSVTLEDCGLFG